MLPSSRKIHKKPFYLNPTWNIPTPKRLRETVRKYPTEFMRRRSLMSMVTLMDKDMGKILDLLEQLGIEKNTLVIFTSDNGPHNEGGHKVEANDRAGHKVFAGALAYFNGKSTIGLNLKATIPPPFGTGYPPAVNWGEPMCPTTLTVYPLCPPFWGREFRRSTIIFFGGGVGSVRFAWENGKPFKLTRFHSC